MWLSRDKKKPFMGGRGVWYNLTERRPEFSRSGIVKDTILSLCESVFEEETGIKLKPGESRKVKKVSFELVEEEYDL
ncbi:hypothetical protein LCGC14_1205020 [marine sediment metagenome]|uniref:Uncharacterized protein n=1 Tax=marine sediment metagenome TaxID=412755 RepID=A0A0F9PKK8_9ZZZZ